ncbi:MAG: hypothetical protein R3E83_25085 [Burkholderiaceae bacterium]
MNTLPDFAYQRMDSRTDARSAFDTATENARRRILVFDRDDTYYGLSRAELAGHFDQFLRRGPDARIEILLQQTQDFQVRCPRLMSLMLRHGERILVRQAGGAAAHYERGLAVFDEAVVLRRPHVARPVTVWDAGEEAIAEAAHLLCEISEQAGPPLSPVATGL